VEDLAQAADRERFLSHYDGLTGLANLSRLRGLARQALIRARDLGQSGPALLILGISRFARLNSLHGRAKADRFLQAAAARLQQALKAAPQATVLARLGGAEFGVLIEPPAAIRDAAALARVLLRSLAPPIVVDDSEIGLTARIGIAMAKSADGHVDAETLLTHANAALAEAKEGETNSIRFYSDSFAATAWRTESLGLALRRALDENALTLLFQPVVDVATRRMVGAEALLRWPHPELGLLAPDSFLDEAARAGLAQRLGDWVLRQALTTAAEWTAGPLAGMRLSINLDAEQFRDKALAERVVDALAHSGCDPRALTLELTETVVSESLDDVASLMNKLKARGVHLAIDDFGTGYSSLSYLK
ncbi:MAG: phosphodiesterase, partial [Alphaproteobacteria bacterium]